jgi:hypothetical protein
MAKKRRLEVYERVFFDRLLLVGIIFLALSYILQNTWAGAFCEAATFIVGVVWTTRAATTNPKVSVRLLATLILVLEGCLLALYLGASQHLV